MLHEREQIVSEYRIYLKSLALSAATFKRRINSLKKLFSFMDLKGKSGLNALTADDMQALSAYLQSGLSLKVAGYYGSGIGFFFDYLVENKLLSFNPWYRYKHPFTEHDYAGEFKVYYDRYLGVLSAKGPLPNNLKPGLRRLLSYLHNRGITRFHEIGFEVTAGFIEFLKEDQAVKGFKQSHVIQTRHYVKGWFLWLKAEGIADLLTDKNELLDRACFLNELEQEYLVFLRSKGDGNFRAVKRLFGLLSDFCRSNKINDICLLDRVRLRRFKADLKARNYSRALHRCYLLQLKKLFAYLYLSGRTKEQPFAKSIRKTAKHPDLKLPKKRFRVLDRVPGEQRAVYFGYENYLELRGHRPRGIEHLQLRITPFFDYMKACGLSHFGQVGFKEAQAYQGWLKEWGLKKGINYKKSTLSDYLQAAASFFNYLKHEKLMPGNPFLEIRRVRVEKHLPGNVLKEKELCLLLDELACFTDHGDLKEQKRCYRVHVFCELLYAGGLRISEAAALRVDDIDFERSLVRVREGKAGKERCCFLNEYARDVLKIYVQLRDRVLTRSNAGRESLLFGASYDPLGKNFNSYLSQRSEALGLGYFTSHGFRHCLGSHLLRSGCDIRYVQSFLGHERLSTTEVYTKIDKDDLKAVLNHYHPRQLHHRDIAEKRSI